MQHRFTYVSVLTTVVLSVTTTSFAGELKKKQEAFLKSLQELDAKALDEGWAKAVGLRSKVLSVSKPRSFRPKVSRFKGWYVDSDGKHQGAKDDKQVDTLILAKDSAASSWWQLVSTDKGFLIVSTGGAQEGRVLSVDEKAKTRPEGPHLTVTECLRLSNKVTPTSYWKVTLTDKGVIVQSTAGKYKDWYWDFGGGAEPSKEGERQVAHNVLLAEKEVAGSYYDVVTREE